MEERRRGYRWQIDRQAMVKLVGGRKGEMMNSVIYNIA
jgi:hypothetical protein